MWAQHGRVADWYAFQMNDQPIRPIMHKEPHKYLYILKNSMWISTIYFIVHVKSSKHSKHYFIAKNRKHVV